MKAPQEFRFAHQDRWGNAHVFCPVCGEIRKIDGIKKHILTQSKLGGFEHTEWLNRNPLANTRAVHTLPLAYTQSDN